MSPLRWSLPLIAAVCLAAPAPAYHPPAKPEDAPPLLSARRLTTDLEELQGALDGWRRWFREATERAMQAAALPAPAPLPPALDLPDLARRVEQFLRSAAAAATPASPAPAASDQRADSR